MIEQTTNTVANEINKLNEKETSAVLDYISGLLSHRKAKSKDNLNNDDLIVSLSNAPENKRARQVFEWEKVRRQRAA